MIINYPSNDDSGLGVYLKQISRYKTIDAKREAYLAKRIRKGDSRAAQELINANLRFVISVAKNYKDQGIPLEDLINIGNMGLIRAAKKFDERKNFKFISYAVWWIRQSILQAMAEQSRLFKLPINRVGTIYQVGKAEEMLEQRLGRKPTLREISEHTKIDKEKVKDARKQTAGYVSLFSPIGSDSERTFTDVIETDTDALPDKHLEINSVRMQVAELLETLSGRERDIVEMYFGFEDGTLYTLDEIGRRLDLTRERVRQIKNKALLKLRQNASDAQIKLMQTLIAELAHETASVD